MNLVDDDDDWQDSPTPPLPSPITPPVEGYVFLYTSIVRLLSMIHV